MVAPVSKTQTVEVLTTDATTATLFDAGAILNTFLFAIVSAQETTALENTDHRVFIVAGIGYSDFESTLTVTSVDGGNGGIGAAGWTAVWADNGGDMQLRVTGEANIDITWRATIIETPGR